jgi:outer membrane receptor protein involved in Fe transport
VLLPPVRAVEDLYPGARRETGASRFVAGLVLAVLLLSVHTARAWGQSGAVAPETGTLVGRVFDASTGSALEGVSVVLSWSAGGEAREARRISDGEGAFEFGEVPSGTHTLRFERSGYRDSTMTDFVVLAGQPNRADFPLPPAVAAQESGSAPEEFVVRAEKVEDLLDLRVESDQLLNVVGVEEFSKFSAGDVAEVLERVAGVNIVEGQFAIIRGLEDRYSSSLYNGAPVPSPDPDRQSVQLDLFPSEVVHNLSVAKTFSPELPSNSAGGAIDIVTHEYPDEIQVGAKAGTGYNENAADRFLEFQDHTSVDRIVKGLRPRLENGVEVFPNIDALEAQGFRFVGGNPVGREADKDGDWLDDIEDVLERDFGGSLAGRKEFGEREFRFKGVISNEVDYTTAEGSVEKRESQDGPGKITSFELNPNPPPFFVPVTRIVRTSELSLGELGTTEGQFDLTTSQREEQTTYYGGFGFDLDDEADHKIDASWFHTSKDEETVELEENGFLPDVDYDAVFQAQQDSESLATLLDGTTGFISGAIRPATSASLSSGGLAFASFTESTSFQRDRDLDVKQINGDHRFDDFPGLHFSWSVNEAETTQDDAALGLTYFFEPCGYAGEVPCPAGTSPITGVAELPVSPEDLGPGLFVSDGFTLSGNRVDENSRFYRLDLDYEAAFSDSSSFTIAGGFWREEADREVDSSFLESPGVAARPGNEICTPGATEFYCLDETASGLGGSAFNDLTYANGNLSGIRETESDASRDVDAWHLRGKLTFWEKLDLLGGVRREEIRIESRNDPFFLDPVTGEAVFDSFLGPSIYPSRYLFLDRLDNPFTGEVFGTPPDDFAYNDEILGTGVVPGPCTGDDGSRGEIECVDFASVGSLQEAVNGSIDEKLDLPSVGLALRPIEGLTLRGAWSESVARPSFREMGFYVTVEPGSDDLVVGNPTLQLSDVESWDGRVEYTWGTRGDLLAFSYFEKEIQDPIESILVRDPTNAELNAQFALFRTFFNNPNTADVSGFEVEARKSIDFLGSRVPDWLEYFSIGGNYTDIDAEVDRTEAELARSEPFYGAVPGEGRFAGLETSRRLFNQPEWIANADLTFDHPESGWKATLAYFAISDVLDAAGTATLGPSGSPLTFTLDRYVDSFDELRFTISKTLELPRNLGRLTLRATGKNLTDSKRRLIYDPDQTARTIVEREFRVGRDFDFSIGFTRTF